MIEGAETWWPLSGAEWEAIRLSLQVAALATAASLPFGVALAWLLARRRFPGKTVLETVAMLPLVLPPVVTGYLLLYLLGQNGPIGSRLAELGVSVAFSFWGAALAGAVVAFPLMLRSMRTTFETLDRRHEEAARTLGAGPWATFFTVSLPLGLPGVLAGTLLAFGRCLGEFGATITFAGNLPGVTRTFPLAVFTAAQRPGGEASALRLTVVAVLIAFATLALSEWLVRRGRRGPRPTPRSPEATNAGS